MKDNSLKEIINNLDGEGWEICKHLDGKDSNEYDIRKKVKELSLIHGPILVRRCGDEINIYKLNSYGENIDVVSKQENFLDRFYSFLREIFLGREY